LRLFIVRPPDRTTWKRNEGRQQEPRQDSAGSFHGGLKHSL
jgi:hypothetical protein